MACVNQLTEEELGKVDEMLRGEDPVGTIDQEQLTDVTVNDLEPVEDDDVKSEEATEIEPSRVSLDLNLEPDRLAEPVVKASTHRPMSQDGSASHVTGGSRQAVSLLTNQIE